MNIYTKQLPPVRHYDVIVVGSGSAGAVHKRAGPLNCQ
jgi:hypothetical protein